MTQNSSRDRGRRAVEAGGGGVPERGIPSLVLEMFSCIASLWQLKTYDRLRLYLPKQYCSLPMVSFPAEFLEYPTKQKFVAYLEEYAARFEIRPRFNTVVESAEYDRRCGVWRVRTKGEAVEYACPQGHRREGQKEHGGGGTAGEEYDSVGGGGLANW